jgi:hypothetical protein
VLLNATAKPLLNGQFSLPLGSLGGGIGTPGDSGEHVFCKLTGLLRSEGSVFSEHDASNRKSAASARAVLDVVAHGSVAIEPGPEPFQVVVSNDGWNSTREQHVNGSL